MKKGMAFERVYTNQSLYICLWLTGHCVLIACASTWGSTLCNTNATLSHTSSARCWFSNFFKLRSTTSARSVSVRICMSDLPRHQCSMQHSFRNLQAQYSSNTVKDTTMQHIVFDRTVLSVWRESHGRRPLLHMLVHRYVKLVMIPCPLSHPSQILFVFPLSLPAMTMS